MWRLCFLLPAARFFHSGALWVEEAYPLAGAIEILAGRVPYRDFWYDKPPLVPLFYLLCGGADGWALRLLGYLFCAAAVWCAHGFARDVWSEREGRLAAWLTAIALVFNFPATALAIAPDLFLVLPHFAAVWLAWRGRAFASGLVAGLALLANFKAVLVAAVCAVLLRRALPRWTAGLAAPLAVGFVLLFSLGAWTPFVEQAWWWGRVYAAQGLRPLADGVTRTAATLGYQAGFVVAAGVFLWRERQFAWLAWLGGMLASAWLGARYFPRYYLAALPPLVLMAARGLRFQPWPAVLLLIPILRFGPSAVTPPAADLALFSDARAAVARVPGAKSVFVWGYRPEINVLARVGSGTPFLESQPLTGVFADRHLGSAEPAASDAFTRRQRARLRDSRPEVIIDGLGPLNPALAITAYPDLAPWLAGYREIGRTRTCVIYRSNTASASPETR